MNGVPEWLLSEVVYYKNLDGYKLLIAKKNGLPTWT